MTRSACCTSLLLLSPPLFATHAHPVPLRLFSRFDSFRELPQDLQISYNIVIILSLVVMFLAFEGVELLRELDSNNKYVDELKDSKPGGPASESELIIRERRRGLGWLALVTGIAVWATGVLNAPNPFGQP